MTAAPLPPGSDLEFTCPRCEGQTRSAYYGPCERCLGELRTRFAASKQAVAEVLYEPKMNVTPNAVALKDD